MELTIRSLNWTNTDEDGIPKDALQIMNYFNKAIKEGAYPFVPRKTRITKEEIKKLWLPTKDRNISIVGELEGRIVGSGTVLMGNDNAYSEKSKGEPGEYSITLDPDFLDRGIGTKITRRILKEAKERGITVHIHTSTQNIRTVRMMEKIGISPKEEIDPYDRYVEAGLPPAAFYYEIKSV